VGLIHPIIPTPRVRRWKISVWHEMVPCPISHKVPSIFPRKAQPRPPRDQLLFSALRCNSAPPA